MIATRWKLNAQPVGAMDVERHHPVTHDLQIVYPLMEMRTSSLHCWMSRLDEATRADTATHNPSVAAIPPIRNTDE